MIEFLNSTQFALDTLRKFQRKFQRKYPESHVGGSVGLFLYGFDLKRELRDLDMTMPFYKVDETKGSQWMRGSGSDFDICIEAKIDGQEIDIDIKLDNHPFNIVYFEGHPYKVSKLERILMFKKLYAEKGVTKHAMDLINIQAQMIKKYEEVVLNPLKYENNIVGLL